MEKEFIIEFLPYELALKMKQLGFNEPGIASRDMGKGQGLIQIPLYQQAFRWFREKYDKYGVVNIDLSNNLKDKIFVYMVEDKLGYIIDRSEEHNTYEEAELACLEKLIEIVESKTEK